MGLSCWSCDLESLFSPLFSSPQVVTLQTRERIHPLQLLQLDRRAVVIAVIIIAWFLCV